MALDFKHLHDPCDESFTCAAEKFSRLAPISDEQRALLAKLEENQEEVKAGERIFYQGRDIHEFFVVSRGWLVSSVRNSNGDSAVTDFHLPGDIVGFDQVIYQKADYSTYTLSNAVVCPFPREHLDDLLMESPRLAALLQLTSLIDRALMHDRLSMICTREAHVRLCHLLLQTLFRLKFMNKDLDNQFYCPLTQTVIGETIGITSVHVSRMFARLADMGLIEKERNFIKIKDLDAAMKLCDFVNRYQSVRTDWLPKN